MAPMTSAPVSEPPTAALVAPASTAARNAIASVYALDDAYQAAVKDNDAATMDRILSDDFVLVTGRGQIVGKSALLQEARDANIHFEHQEDSEKTVRLINDDTAVVTALLWVKGDQGGETFDYKLWFSDIYVRTATGWRYAFAQASLRLPTTP